MNQSTESAHQIENSACIILTADRQGKILLINRVAAGQRGKAASGNVFTSRRSLLENESVRM